MVELEAGMPTNIRDAFAHISHVTKPTVTDLKVMVLVEAASETLYRKTAEGTDHPDVIALLHENGSEEMKHARRASEAIRLLGGGDFPPPAAEDNPYLAGGGFAFAEVTADSLRKLSTGEFAGEALYDVWASNVGHADAAALLRANGAEETDHGNRLLQAAELLDV